MNATGSQPASTPDLPRSRAGRRRQVDPRRRLFSDASLLLAATALAVLAISTLSPAGPAPDALDGSSVTLPATATAAPASGAEPTPSGAAASGATPSETPPE